MKQILSFLFFALSSYAAAAQYKPVADEAAVTAQFAAAAAKVNSIASDFTQVKTLTLLSEKITAKGKFYFKAANAVRMEYTTPYQYLMVINGDKVSIKDGQKTSSLSAGSSKMFKQINQLMMDCVKGTVWGNKNFSIQLFEDETTCLVAMTPVTNQMATLFKKVNVVFNKNNFVVHQVQLFEPSGDYTSIRYNNQKINTPLPDALFSIP